jgi:hypothetical protein
LLILNVTANDLDLIAPQFHAPAFGFDMLPLGDANFLLEEQPFLDDQNLLQHWNHRDISLLARGRRLIDVAIDGYPLDVKFLTHRVERNIPNVNSRRDVHADAIRLDQLLANLRTLLHDRQDVRLRDGRGRRFGSDASGISRSLNVL